MASQHDEFALRLHEIAKEARAIVEHAEEALHHFEQGDLQAVSQVLALSHHKVAAYNDCKKAMLEELEKIGIRPGG